MNTISDELLPCPFCGGEAAPTAHLEYSWFAPVCKSCGVSGPTVRIERGLEPQKLRELMNKADALWNTRAVTEREQAEQPACGVVDRWITQTLFYDPTQPQDVCTGNCTEAAFASILGISLDDVPSFYGLKSADYWIALDEFCESRGFELFRLQGEKVFEGLYLANGPSERGCGHFVVMRDGKLQHDPHPSRAGLKSIENTWLLLPLDPATAALRTPSPCPHIVHGSDGTNHCRLADSAGPSPAQVPDRHIAVPVALPALAVSEIKDILEIEYGMRSVQARPLWASLLTIVAGISIDDQIAINEQARAAPTPPSAEQ